MTTPEHLSALPVDGPECEPPFGLTWEDLAPALPGFSTGLGARVSHQKRGRHQGGRASVIITLRYRSASGPVRDRTVFVKRNSDGTHEAEAYRFLAARGIPVPELLAAVPRGPTEVLVTEFLPSVGTAPDDIDELLRLIAGLNALTDVSAGMADPPPGLPDDAFARSLHAALAQVDACRPGLEAMSWLDLYRRALPRYRAGPHGLTHGELAPQQLGRTRAGRLVVFDLATLGFRPRFFDLAGLMTLLTHQSGTGERGLVDRYRHELEAVGGTSCGPADVWPEWELTRFVHELEALPWHLEVSDPVEIDRRLRTLTETSAAVRDQVDG